jgi:nucleoside-diphosphate-sugar epimerase
LGSSVFLYQLLDTPDRLYPPNPFGHLVDVRDVARIHVLALDASPLPNSQHKRLVVSNCLFKWNELVDIVKAWKPELASRLPSEDAAPGPQMTVPIDTSLTTQAVGLESYIPATETFVAAFDAVLNWERQRKA